MYLDLGHLQIVQPRLHSATTSQGNKHLLFIYASGKIVPHFFFLFVIFSINFVSFCYYQIDFSPINANK